MNKYAVLIIVASLISPKHFLSGTPQFEATKRLSLPYTPTIQTARWHPRLNKLAILACEIIRPPDSKSYTLQFHDLQSKEHTDFSVFDPGESAHPIALHPTGDTIACGNKGKHITQLYSSSNKPTRRFTHVKIAQKVPTFCAIWEKYGLIKALLNKAFNDPGFTNLAPQGINSVAWSPDGLTLASGSVEGTVYIHDSRMAPICQSSIHQEAVNDIAFNPSDANQLASSSQDSTVQIWDMRNSKKAITTCTHPNSNVITVCWSPDGKQLASGSDNSNIYLWQILPVLERNPKKLVGHSGTIKSLSWHPNGSILASGSGSFLEPVIIPGGFELMPDPNSSVDSHEDLRDNLWVPVWVDGERFWSYPTSAPDHSIRLWNPNTAKCIQVLQGHRAHINSVEWSPDGTQLASSSHDGTVVVWEPKREKKIHTPPEKQKTPPPSKLMSFITTALKWIPLGV